MRKCGALIASLERLAPEVKEGLGGPLIKELSRPTTPGYLLWCLGRLGGRVPLYGLANTAVRREAVEQWIDLLLTRQYVPGRETSDAIFALSQLALLGRSRARPARLAARRSPGPPRTAGADQTVLRPVREYHELEAAQESIALGDALLIGPRLREEDQQPAPVVDSASG